MLRHQISNHLIRCPANVIDCVVEWNRWPVHTKDRKLTSSKQILAQTLDINNLDVALALRDQRMLNQLWGAERRTRKIMSNYLTQKYPAVPFKVIQIYSFNSFPLLKSIFGFPLALQRNSRFKFIEQIKFPVNNNNRINLLPVK